MVSDSPIGRPTSCSSRTHSAFPVQNSSSVAKLRPAGGAGTKAWAVGVGVGVGGGGELVGDGVTGVDVAVGANGVGVGSGVGTGVTVDVGLGAGGGDRVGSAVLVEVGEGAVVAVAGIAEGCSVGVVGPGWGSGAQAAATSRLKINEVKSGRAYSRFLMLLREFSAEGAGAQATLPRSSGGTSTLLRSLKFPDCPTHKTVLRACCSTCWRRRDSSAPLRQAPRFLGMKSE